MFWKNKKINIKNTPILFVHIISYWEYWGDSSFFVSGIYIYDIQAKKWKKLGDIHRWDEKKILMDLKKEIQKLIRIKWKIMIWSNRKDGIGFLPLSQRILEVFGKEDRSFDEMRIFLLNEDNVIVLRDLVEYNCIEWTEWSYKNIFLENNLINDDIIDGKKESKMHPSDKYIFFQLMKSLGQKWKNFSKIIELYFDGKLKKPFKELSRAKRVENFIKNNIPFNFVLWTTLVYFLYKLIDKILK